MSEVPEQLDHSVPKWLIWFTIVLFLWGIVWFCLYLDGPWGVMDPGHWRALEEAAGTTFKTP